MKENESASRGTASVPVCEDTHSLSVSPHSASHMIFFTFSVQRRLTVTKIPSYTTARYFLANRHICEAALPSY